MSKKALILLVPIAPLFFFVYSNMAKQSAENSANIKTSAATNKTLIVQIFSDKLYS